MSDGTRYAEALQKLAKHAPPEAFEQEYEKLLRNHPFRAELIGSENPYTGREIASETDYRGFLRECAYASLLDRAERQAEIGRKADRQLERREKEAGARHDCRAPAMSIRQKAGRDAPLLRR